MEEILIQNRPMLIAILIALIGALVTLSVRRRNIDDSILREFVDLLSADIAALADFRNIKKDAFEILMDRFAIQHAGFIKVMTIPAYLRKRMVKQAWQNYYGEEGDQDWWLPNEYSVLLSNQIKNTVENTKNLAIHRLQCLVKLCSWSLR
jgi:hypothetical protein